MMTIRLTHSAESELLRLVLEKIAAGESVAIGFHIAPARIARDRRVAPAEFPSSMLGTEPPAFKAWKRIVARGLYPNIETEPQWHCAGRREVVLKGLHRPRSRRKSGPHRTHRWREMDSNSRSRSRKRETFLVLVAQFKILSRSAR